MPILIQNITGSLADDIHDEIDAFNSIETNFGYDDWFKIGSTEVFLQNYKKVSETIDLNKTRNFGLQINNNKTFTDLNISY
jgi:hypothetical protein